MFGNKKNSRSDKKHDLRMFGMDMGENDDDDDDDDLEAELAALQGNQPQKKALKTKQAKVMALSDIEKLAAECMQDVDDNDDNEEDDDHELLAELEGLSPMDSNVSKDCTPALAPSLHDVPSKLSDSQITVIADRKVMYESAISHAERTGDGSKARRYKRGLKDIDKMLKAMQSGKTVNIEELPPPVATGSQPTVKTPETKHDVSETTLIDFGTTGDKPPPNIPSKPSLLVDPSQPSPNVPNDLPQSISCVPTKPTRPIVPSHLLPDVPNVPSTPIVPPQSTPSTPHKTAPTHPEPCPTGSQETLMKELLKRRDAYKKAAVLAKREGDLAKAREYLLTFKDYNVVIEKAQQGQEVDLSVCPQLHCLEGSSAAKLNTKPVQELPVAAESATLPGAPPAPATVLEALQQRLVKYQEGVDDAKKEGNGGKARRMGRIVKQYQDAIRDHQAKKPVNYDELPVPPGYAPIPVEPPRHPPSAAVPPTVAAPSSHATPSTQNQKELHFLIGRQKEFKMAALHAKKQGDLTPAKNYLRSAKGFDTMIEAAKNGLRVDLTKIPHPPPSVGKNLHKPLKPSTEFVMVQPDDCTADSSNREEIFASLEKSLKHQYEMCKKNMQHYSKLGDIESSKRFEKLALNSRKDYEAVQNAFKHGNPAPRYHYENRTFTIIRSNTDLGDQDCELTIVKCINIPLPSGYSKDDMKVFITFEFPFPNDQPQTGYTECIKHSINPEFKQSFKLSIDRKNRALTRIFRRQNLKLEVKHARGFLKGDKSLGQAAIKLASFDNKTEIHECVDVMDADKGRKAVGGKIEVKLRIREPLVDKDVDILTEKWLVIDAYVVPSNRPISAASTHKDNRPSETRTSNVR